MNLKLTAVFIAAASAFSFAVLLHAAPAAKGAQVDITSPAEGSHHAWNSQVSYAVDASYDGKSTKFGELPANDAVLRVSYSANVDAASARRASPLPDALVQISQSNCTGCHDFTASSAGPSFAAIGKRYSGKVNAAAILAAHIRNGSSGAWGGGTMPPHPDLSPAQASAIAQWIVANGNDPAVHYSIGKSGSFRMAPVGKPGPHSGLVLSGFYTGPLKAGDSRAAAGRTTVVVHGS
jgi:cytochrome c551/c552